MFKSMIAAADEAGCICRLVDTFDWVSLTPSQQWLHSAGCQSVTMITFPSPDYDSASVLSGLLSVLDLCKIVHFWKALTSTISVCKVLQTYRA
jgi:hypothetical protein